MESNQNGEQRKPKRPRIGANPYSGTPSDSRFEKVNYGSEYSPTSNSEGGEQTGESQTQRPYQPRPRYNQQQGGYQPRPYQPRPRYNQQNDGEGGYQQRPYQPRPRYKQQQNGGCI